MPKPGTAVHAPTRKRDWLCEGPRVEDGEVTGELVFDEATDLSKRCKKQFVIRQPENGECRNRHSGTE